MAEQGFLTTHVLDTARGIPGEGIRIELYSLLGGDRNLLTKAITNDDGRTDSPLMPKGSMAVGEYELVFDVKDYFSDMRSEGETPFIATVPIRFGIADASSHYHVPLLVSPFSYSTYRGS